jgi:alpha-tubulin suppressor-like RCC1 family protein
MPAVLVLVFSACGHKADGPASGPNSDSNLTEAQQTAAIAAPRTVRDIPEPDSSAAGANPTVAAESSRHNSPDSGPRDIDSATQSSLLSSPPAADLFRENESSLLLANLESTPSANATLQTRTSMRRGGSGAVSLGGLESESPQLIAGQDHTCAWHLSQRVWMCFGRNDYGQLADGTLVSRAEPRPIRSISPLHTQSDSSRSHPSFQLFSGGLRTWLQPLRTSSELWAAGEQGDGARMPTWVSLNPRNHLQQVLNLRDGERPSVISSAARQGSEVLVALGPFHECLAIGRQVRCRGLTDDVSTWQLEKEIRSITAGRNSLLVILEDQSVWRLGAGFGPRVEGPTRVSEWANLRVQSVAVGDAFACAITDRGRVHCIGNSASGALAGNQLPPHLIFDRVAAGRFHACASTRDQAIPEIWCWGINGRGQVGGSSRVVEQPRRVQFRGALGFGALPRWEIAAGDDHTCARIRGTQSLYCWGSSMHGQLGVRRDQPALDPVAVRW